MIKAVIIDDEKDARENIAEMISMYAPKIKIAGEADGVETGFQLIDQHEPDIVFLDIRMPDGSGFDLLKMFNRINFRIIFITAYEHYAVQAFKFSALDYLLKPVDPDELVNAIENAEEALERESLVMRLNNYTHHLNAPAGTSKKVVLKTAESIHVKSLGDIVSMQSDGSYTEVNLIKGSRIIVSRSLKEFDEMLSEYNFLRIHKSHLINMQHFDRYNKADGGYVVMKDDSSFPVSQRKRDSLLKMLDAI